MNEKKKMYLVLLIFSILCFLILSMMITSTISANQKVQELKDKINQSETKIFYFSRSTCAYCNLLKPITKKLKEKYDLTYEEINIDHISNSQLKKFLKLFHIPVETFGTPYIIITKNGKILGEQNGYSDENVLFELFQKNGLIDSNLKLPLQYINYDTFKTYMNTLEKHIVMIGKTNETSIQARNIISNLAELNHLEISYMDISETGNNDGYHELLKLINHTSEITNPILMIIQGGKVIAETNQISKDHYQLFLQTNGYLK